MFKVDSCLGLLSSDGHSFFPSPLPLYFLIPHNVVVSFAGIENTFALGPFMAVTVTKDLVSYFQPLPHEFYIKWQFVLVLVSASHRRYDENTAFLIVKGEISEEQRGEILKMTQYSIRTYREYVKDSTRHSPTSRLNSHSFQNLECLRPVFLLSKDLMTVLEAKRRVNHRRKKRRCNSSCKEFHFVRQLLVRVDVDSINLKSFYYLDNSFVPISLT